MKSKEIAQSKMRRTINYIFVVLAIALISPLLVNGITYDVGDNQGWN